MAFNPVWDDPSMIFFFVVVVFFVVFCLFAYILGFIFLFCVQHFGTLLIYKYIFKIMF